MKKKVKQTKTDTKTDTKYTASIKVLGKTYQSEGSNAIEAISNLQPQGTVKGVSILTVSNGITKRDKVLTNPQTYRLFSQSKLMRTLALKQMSLIFNGI